MEGRERGSTKDDDAKEAEKGKDEVVAVGIRGREDPAEVRRGHNSSMGRVDGFFVEAAAVPGFSLWLESGEAGREGVLF